MAMEAEIQPQLEILQTQSDESQHATQSQPIPPRRRRRPALACRECRRRKIKCDQKHPCQHCVRHKTQCIYQMYRDGPEPTTPDSARVSRASRRGPAASSSPSQNSTQSQAQQPLPSLKKNNGDQNGANGSATSQSRPDIAPTTHDRLGIPTPASTSQNAEVQELLQRIQRLEHSTQSQAGDGNTAAPSPRSEVERQRPKRQRVDASLEWETMLNKSRDLGRGGGWTESFQEFAPIITCWGEIMGKVSSNPSFREPDTAALVAEAGELLRKSKRTAKGLKVARPTRGLSSLPDLPAPPPREICDTMANLYVTSFETTLRILHIPSFWRDYQTYWDPSGAVSADTQLIVLLAIGIGSSLVDHGSPEAALRNTELVHHWIYAAETWLVGPLEKDRVSVTGLQVYCLTILARQVFSIGGDTVWMSMGALVHRAMQIGLHRDPQCLPGQPMLVLPAEVRRRLWATVLELVVQASLDDRMPPRISFDEFNTEPPSNINDDEMDETTSTIQPHPRDQFTSSSIQLALFDSLPTRLRILQMLSGFEVDRSYQQTLALSAELMDALKSNSRLMRNGSGSSPFQRNLLDYQVRRFVIPLHFAFSNQARTNPEYYYSLKLSVDAANALMSPEKDDCFSRLMVFGGGMFREGLRVVTVAVPLALLIHVQNQHVDGTLQRPNQYRELLKQSIRDMISMSEDRIRQGETNIKSPMFLHMILAQVEAIEADLPLEARLARSARDSLEYCYDIIKQRAENVSLAWTPGSGLEGIDIGPGYGLDVYGLDVDWESYMPDQAFFSEMAT